MITLGFDVGGTKVAYGTLVNGRLLDSQQVPAPPGDYEALVALIADVVSGSEIPVDVVGVGVAAWMSADREIVHRSANLGWDDMPLRADLARALGVPVRVVNDADAAAWGAHGRECVCGGIDCLATVASGTALIRHVRALAETRPEDFPTLRKSIDSSSLGPADIAAASEGECILMLADAATGIAAASAIVSRVIDHDTLVLAGGVSAIGAPLHHAVLAALQATPRIGNVRSIPEVYLAPADVPVGVLGAAHLAGIA